MPKGGIRKPAALRILEGNRSRTEIPVEAPVAKGMPTPPEWLSPLARQAWDRVAPDLHGAGLLALSDGEAFAAYCQTWAAWRAADKWCQRHGDVIATTNSAGADVNMIAPQATLRLKYLAEFVRMGRLFGLSPAARTALAGALMKKDKPSDPFAEAMA
jgi:P27 family predicted phage terminase small subunit